MDFDAYWIPKSFIPKLKEIVISDSNKIEDLTADDAPVAVENKHQNLENKDDGSLKNEDDKNSENEDDKNSENEDDENSENEDDKNNEDSEAEDDKKLNDSDEEDKASEHSDRDQKNSDVDVSDLKVNEDDLELGVEIEVELGNNKKNTNDMESDIRDLNDRHTFKELREICKTNNLNTQGRKLELAKRIVEYRSDIVLAS